MESEQFIMLLLHRSIGSTKQSREREGTRFGRRHLVSAVRDYQVIYCATVGYTTPRGILQSGYVINKRGTARSYYY